MSKLEFKVQTFSADELTIKVQNTSVVSLDENLSIEIYTPAYLVSAAVNEAAIKASKNKTPPGAMRLDGVVTGPEGWAIWARRESSDSTIVVVLINDQDQTTGELKPPIKFPAGAESTIRIPLNPESKRDNIDLMYSYTHGDPQNRVDGKLELKSVPVDEPPDVTLRTNETNPTMIKAGDLVKVIWHVKNGVSATLRGPLPGDNSELSLSSAPDADFKIADGFLTVRVVGLMNYILQAEVTRPNNQPNLQVMRMLTLDTSNKKHLYLGPRQGKVLPYGTIEMDWAAWGVPQIEITAPDVTRIVKLTQQTFGGSYEGQGIMRLSASKAGTETVLIEAKPETRSKSVLVVTWQHMIKPDINGPPLGLAVIAPKLALLTRDGLFIADVGKIDPSPALRKLMFVRKTDATAIQWAALTALDNRFVCLRRAASGFDFEVAPYTIDGNPDVIPPVTLHPDLRPIATHTRAVFDFVGFGGRVYVVAEAPSGRRAYSVAFDSNTGKAEFRAEPLLQDFIGYRLLTFDDALYALNRESGHMFRFELTNDGKLGPPMLAATAVKKENDQNKSMIRDGLIVPIGRVLVVLSPTSVPTLESLSKYDLHNVLAYETSSSTDPTHIPQDLIYNPQKNYWGRCGHDLDVKPGAVGAFRGGDSPRLWVIQPDGETHTLAVGSESLFSRDYVLNFPTDPFDPYILNKKRKFTIKHPTMLGPIEARYLKIGITEVSADGPKEVSALPTRPQMQFDVDVGYDAKNPTPVTLRRQIARRPESRADVDYLLEVTFSGPDLSTATSCVRRLSVVGAKVSNDEVFGSRMQHSTNGIIEVPRPARFDEQLKFVFVNASNHFRIKTSLTAPRPLYVLTTAYILVNHDQPDFTLQFEGKVRADGVIGVNFNFALPYGIESSPSSQPQTKLIRLNTDLVQKIEVMLVKLLMPGDQPLKLEGAEHPIEPLPNGPVFVCQLNYQLPK